ncbi:HTH-type transcriptional regulator / antitoxin HipB [Pseudoxanthomonas sp. GM95]|uniref:helix-turn-helix transcriptional regulator n=1 Tax=Pseudoxanthomonas sp. GM95 TaxID=1881043 RepID=UPI0008C5DE06|nr:helix-turn-helix transcriptional regulator [Pseudoxanthomonas sp. GM95]SEM58025.1 HTH-type transcriptional regulator / antitoxin HipB [Pseudoxanthomonas sp. GM95]
MATIALLKPAQLSEIIKGARRAKGMTQVELAQRLQVSQQRISSMENDPSSMTLEQALKLCAFLDLELAISTTTRQKKPTTPTSRAIGDW